MTYAALLAIAAVCAQPTSFIRNGRFNSLAQWTVPPGATIVERAPGDKCLLVLVGAAWQEIPVRPGWQTLTVAVDIRVEEIRAEDGGFAYAAIYQYSDAQQLVAFRDFVQLRKPAPWRRYSYTFKVQPGAATIRLFIGFYRAAGRAYFDNCTLVEGSRPMGPDEVVEWGARVSAQPAAVIWHQPDLAAPEALPISWARQVLERAGFRVALADAEALPRFLDPARWPIAIFPYGDAYPHSARSAIISFCRAGGKLLIVGGYPFNRPLARENGRWIDYRRVLDEKRRRALQWPNSLIADPGFEAAENAPVGGRQLDGRWRRDHEKLCPPVSENPAEGSKCARVIVQPNEPLMERKWYAWIKTSPGREYLFTALARARSVSGPGYAYVAVYQYAGDRLVHARDVLHLRGTTDWQRCQFRFTTRPGANRILVKMGIYRAHGIADFDKVQLVDLTPYRYRPLNTSSGQPRDGLQCAAFQMGMCDADFPLARVARIRPARDSDLCPIEVQGRAEGWAASGVQSGARWIPLLDAMDRYGRLRGAAGAILAHHSGFYAGSIWAYFPVRKPRLFGPGVPHSAAALVRLARWLMRGCFIASLRPEYLLAAPGEQLAVTCAAFNAGGGAFSGTIRLTAGSAGSSKWTARASIDIQHGQQAEAKFTVPIPRAARGKLLVITAELFDPAGRAVDRAQTAIVVRDRRIQASGPRIDFSANYFRLNGRPVFLFGSDAYLHDYLGPTANPLNWQQMLDRARDIGLTVYENLQYPRPKHRMSDWDWRAFEAMAQMIQQRGLVFMVGLLVGHNVVVDDAGLEEQASLCAEYARRLGHIPGLIWYINGDFRLQYPRGKRMPDWFLALWRRWLAENYSDAAELARAWGLKRAVPLAEAPFPPPRTDDWSCRAEVDRIRFNAWLMRRWISRHVAAIRQHERRRPITSEYYSEPWAGLDLRATLDGHDVANFGFFAPPREDLRVLPERIAINDMRYAGKGVNIGEYGCKTHPAWTVENGARGYHIVRTHEQQKQLFMTVAAYALGMGVSKIQNWCLRDADDRVFPWGLLYPGRNVPKDVAYVHRNLSMLWRLLQPRWQPPEVWVVACQALRLGPDGAAGRNAVYAATQALLRLGVPRLATIDDVALDKLPPEARLVVAPALVAAPQAAFERLERFVRRGGQLIISGMPAWDELRRPTPGRLPRLLDCSARGPLFPGTRRNKGPKLAARLEGRRFEVRPQARLEPSADCRAIAAADDGTPLVVARSLGRGAVVWIADPAEVEGAAALELQLALYRLALAALPQPPQLAPLRGGDGQVHALCQPTATGRVWVLYGLGEEGARRDVDLKLSCGRIRLKLANWWPAVFAESRGRLVMAMAPGPVSVDGQQLWGYGVYLGAAALDGRDLRESKAILICPFKAGRGELSIGPGLPLRWGEWVRGKWVEYEKLPAGRIDIDADRATLVALACPEGAEGRWQRVLEDLARAPWRLRGY